MKRNNLIILLIFFISNTPAITFGSENSINSKESLSTKISNIIQGFSHYMPNTMRNLKPMEILALTGAGAFILLSYYLSQPQQPKNLALASFQLSTDKENINKYTSEYLQQLSNVYIYERLNKANDIYEQLQQNKQQYTPKEYELRKEALDTVRIIASSGELFTEDYDKFLNEKQPGESFENFKKRKNQQYRHKKQSPKIPMPISSTKELIVPSSPADPTKE